MRRRVLIVMAGVAGAVAIALIATVRLSFQGDLAAAHARVAASSSIVHTRCGDIEYATEGQGPPLLILHGAGGGFDQGLEFGRPLVAAGYRVIAPSRFGYLRTPLPSDASPAAQADAHACLLDALGIPTVAVLGGSAGAPSAMQLCLRHPERCSAMVLVVPLAYAPDAAEAVRTGIVSGGRGRVAGNPSALVRLAMDTALRSDFAFWALVRLMPDLMIRSILATPVEDVRNASPRERERIMQTLHHILPVSSRAAGLRNDARIAGSLPRFELERIATPTLVVSVENDLYGTYASARYTARHIPRGRFVGFPTGGHVWVEQDRLWPAIVDFLRSGPTAMSHSSEVFHDNANE